MSKRMGILLMVFLLSVTSCGKKTESTKEEKQTAIEIQVPTTQPTAEPTAEPTAQSVGEQVQVQEESQIEGKTASIQDYFTADLPEGYTMLLDEKNKVVTIAKDGIKVGKLTVHEAYRGKRDAEAMLSGLLEVSGAVTMVKTYTKEAYLMSKIAVATDLTKEEIASGKLSTGIEETHYLYYKNQTPTTVLELQFTNLTSEVVMDKIAGKIELT